MVWVVGLVLVVRGVLATTKGTWAIVQFSSVGSLSESSAGSIAVWLRSP